MEARAIHRYIGTSPRKMRLVVDLIRGKSVDDALHILHYSPHAASRVAEKVVRSAVANLQNKDGAGRVEPDQMTVREVFVDVGMTVKRISPAPMGRGFRIRKRSNHLTVIVETKPDAGSEVEASGSRGENCRAEESSGAEDGEGNEGTEGHKGTEGAEAIEDGRRRNEVTIPLKETPWDRKHTRSVCAWASSAHGIRTGTMRRPSPVS